MQLGISRGVIVHVFGQLQEEGYLVARVGAGTSVATQVPEDFLSSAKVFVPPLPEETDPLYRRPVRAFRTIEPGLAEFPVETWARVAGRCMRKMSTAILAGGDVAGYLPLREAIAAYLGASRGVACHAGQIFITSGTQQSLDCIARVLTRPGDALWMEDPGYSGAVDAFRLAGAKIIPVPVDEEGLNVDRGREVCRNPRAIYLTPAHQFPLGVTLSLDRKIDLLQYTRKQGIAVIEDDYDSEFRFSGRPIPAMRGLASSDHVFLLGTFNKSLFPSLRLAYMVVPDPYLDPMRKLRLQVERYPPGISQIVLASFLEDGHYGKHLRRMREIYGSRLAALQAAVRRYLEGVLRLPNIEAGLNTPAFLENGMTSTEAHARATAAGVECWPLDQFALARRDLQGLVLGFAAIDEKAIRRGVQLLARALC